LKEGDWVRCEVTYTGSPPENFPTNTRIEVLEIEGTTITIKIEMIGSMELILQTLEHLILKMVLLI
jgi:hypothetical protein